VVTSVRMMPLPEAVAIPFFAQQLDAGAFKPSETNEKAATVMLDELARWSAALATLRG